MPTRRTGWRGAARARAAAALLVLAAIVGAAWQASSGSVPASGTFAPSSAVAPAGSEPPTPSPSAPVVAVPSVAPDQSEPPEPSAPPERPEPSVAPDADAAPCPRPPSSGIVERADEILANRYRLGVHGPVDLPADPTWAEDPLESNNWQFNLHTLRFTLALFQASEVSGETRYLERAAELLRDWIEDNPRDDPATRFAWNDHAAAWRASVLVCAAQHLGEPPWLREALVAHGEALASEAFYIGEGNHALNQNIGLLDIACRMDHGAWKDIAVERLGALAARSIDAEGVTNEQSVFYQAYNWIHYGRARERMAACGLEPPATFDRVDLMPAFLAHATLPNGEYVRLGDTSTTLAEPIRDTVAEFAATRGERGPAPDTRFVTFEAGFTFGRSGWGESRPFEDEIAWSIRHGGGRVFHGHGDHTAVTLYGFGGRLLEDSGVFTYNRDEWREYAVSHRAHNVVVVDGLEYDQSQAADLVRQSSGPNVDEVVVRDGGYRGIANIRRVVFSPALGYLVIEDTLVADASRTFHQLWHLPIDGNAVLTESGVRTRRAGANVEILQLAATRPARIISGQMDPIQGWLSEAFEQHAEAPVADFATVGASAHYVTLLIPAPDEQPRAAVADVAVTPDGFSFRITIDGRTERVVADADGVTITGG